MANMFRISIDFNEKSSEALVLEKKISQMGFAADVRVSDVYTVRGNLSRSEVEDVAKSLHNETVQTARINAPFSRKFDWALELGMLPGVTDNAGHTAREIVADMLKKETDVFSSKVLYIGGRLAKKDVEAIANSLVNTLIQRFHIKSSADYARDGGMDAVAPDVKLHEKQEVIWVDLNVGDGELAKIGKLGILDPLTKLRRGPLALDVDYMHAIKKYFSKLGRAPTDIELESLAQTWSEHCKHTYFSAAIDEIEDGLFSHYIKRATEEINSGFCASVFRDNSGAVRFDDDFLVTDKVETHNTPSALDPFGGSITGIVGVNRDTIGFGMGAKPIANRYGFCVGFPEDSRTIYKAKNQPVLTPKRIFEGVISGVNVGGNCSGIPTPQGFVYFDDCYRGKPLVFAGTVGIIPARIGNSASHEKKAQPGDNIVMIGGRVGKDGIHGATFSSEAMDEGSPVTAVQIGDPITQKKLSDAVVKEARDRNLYSSITDNGAGGLSCSVAEMARECGGFIVELDKVPLKYPRLQPWEIWISESQERMTLAVPDSTLGEFAELMKSRGIEASVIGKFTGAKKAVVSFRGVEIFNIDMDFLHNGLPKRRLATRPYPYKGSPEPELRVQDHEDILKRMLARHNLCSFEFISRQYDHEVQGGSIVKPLQGRGRVNGAATVIRPLLSNRRGVVLSQSLYPRLSEISAYDMAACAIDTAIRNCVAAGGDISRLALLDNFCWCSSDEPERLHQLKDAARACYDYAKIYGTPFISGKDSMFNDFKGLDSEGAPVKISVLPTLLISAIGIVEDVANTCTMDFKMQDDAIYVVGMTGDECGGGEFYGLFGETGSRSPKVCNSRKLYEKICELNKKGLLSSMASVGPGGIAVALAKMSIAGMLGAECDIGIAPNRDLPPEKIMYSESQGRFIVAIAPGNMERFGKEMKDFTFARIGVVKGGSLRIDCNGRTLINLPVAAIDRKYKERFGDW
ncbi:MAG: phosphoribosylformylglycinamidine synthase [archaeon GW2011_AR5]|nr:MAG: phosphoribosylformylglycinamidine synthase [archaeon GW2011_AR5]